MSLVQYIMDKIQLNYQDDYDDELEEEHEEHFDILNHFKNAGADWRGGEEAMQVSLLRAESIEDSKEICDQLLMGNAVVINMEKASGDQKSRIIDFISGAVYGVNGRILPVSHAIFMAAPENIELYDREPER